MPHHNASLTGTGRLRLVRSVVEDRWPLLWAAELFQVSPTTPKRNADHFLTFTAIARALICYRRLAK